MEISNLIYRKESFERLSDEAKDVVMLILETPFELLQMLFTDNWGLFSRRRLRRFLRKRNGWDKWKTKRVLKELRSYTKEICED